MARRLSREDIVTIENLASRGVSRASIARTLDVTEGAVRYHLKKAEHREEDGRRKARLLDDVADAVESWRLTQQGEPINLAALHDWLVREHGYAGSLRSVQRGWRARYGAPRKRARRRVETPPGAQAQIDWAHFPGMVVGGADVDLYAFHLLLSFSRRDAIVWATSKDQISWIDCHNRAFERIEGVPATCRIDNEKTAMMRGAGPWGTVHPVYQRYAEQMHFHVDPCLPRAPEAKGKVERRILTQRTGEDPTKRHWTSLDELQQWTDRMTLESATRLKCPATGTSVLDAWRMEQPLLTPIMTLPAPFDVQVMRQVGIDCLVSFESRKYSVPFRHVGRFVSVRGCAGTVQVLLDHAVVAEHERWTARRIVLDPAHYEGESTDEVLAPTPLGRVGAKLQAIAEQKTHVRSIDIYAQLAEAIA